MKPKGLDRFFNELRKEEEENNSKEGEKTENGKIKIKNKRLPANNDCEFDLNENETFHHRITYAFASVRVCDIFRFSNSKSFR